MQIYLYAQKDTEGLIGLLSELGAIRLRRFDGMRFWRQGKPLQFNKGDVLIGWGYMPPKLEGVQVINPFTKYVNDSALNIGKQIPIEKSVGVPCAAMEPYVNQHSYQKALKQFQEQGFEKFAKTANELIPVKEANGMFTYLIQAAEKHIKVHVIGGQVVRVAVAGNDGKYKGVPSHGIQDYAVQIVNALGLQFGVVTFLSTKNNRQTYVRKIVTAPKLSDEDIRAYGQAFRALIGG